MEANHEDLWVANRLATIEPQWSPNLARGRKLLDARLEGRRSHLWTWLAAAAATAAVCVAVLALPGTRAIAQEFWVRLILNRVDVVRLDLSKLPLHMQVTTNGLEKSVRDIDEAERKAGFRPYLPSPGALDANPDITVTPRILVERALHVRDAVPALCELRAMAGNVAAHPRGLLDIPDLAVVNDLEVALRIRPGLLIRRPDRKVL